MEALARQLVEEWGKKFGEGLGIKVRPDRGAGGAVPLQGGVELVRPARCARHAGVHCIPSRDTQLSTAHSHTLTHLHTRMHAHTHHSAQPPLQITPLTKTRQVAMLSGEAAADAKLLEKTHLAIATPESWDAVSRRWKQRKAVQVGCGVRAWVCGVCVGMGCCPSQLLSG